VIPGFIRAAVFQPFASRERIDVVVGLSFDYDPHLVEVLKATLRDVRAYHQGLPQGGWLKDHKKWFVEIAAWPRVKGRLTRLGYIVRGGPETEGEPAREQHTRRQRPQLPDLTPIIRTWHADLARRYHRDCGGSDAEMKVVEYAKYKLEQLLETGR
jgi:hypothetical protein